MNKDIKNTTVDSADKKDNAVLIFIKSNWKEIFKPITVLTVICLITSLLLAVVNTITAPIIKEMNIKVANEARQELLPTATGFSPIDKTGEGVTGMFKSDNDVGYVFTAEAKGYGGAVPVMVAIDKDHNISKVKFMANEETPGLGQKILQESFAAQFNGKPVENISLGDIDAIAGATISSSAAVAAVNSVIDIYKAEVKKEVVVVLTPEELRAKLLPDAGAITKIEFTADGVKEVYKGESYGYIIYVEGKGFYQKPLPAIVALDNDGVITGVYVDGTNETKGVGAQIGADKFTEQFKTKTTLDGIEAVAGATVSSDAAVKTIQIALDVFNAVKGA